MAVRHVTDEEIQAYLDEGSDVGYAAFETHVQVCESCRSRLAHYKVLYQGLRDDRGYDLNPGFSDAVMARVAVGHIESSRWSRINSIAVILGSLVLLGLLVYFLDLRSLGAALAQPFAPLAQTGVRLMDKFGPLLSSGQVNVGVYIFCGLILAVVSFLDYILFHVKDRTYCL